jgi:hypothetical protein
VGMDLCITPLGQSGDQIRNVKKLNRPAPNPVSQHEQALGSKGEREEESRRSCAVYGLPEWVDMTSTKNNGFLLRLLQSCTPHFILDQCLSYVFPFNIFD